MNPVCECPHGMYVHVDSFQCTDVILFLLETIFPFTCFLACKREFWIFGYGIILETVPPHIICVYIFHVYVQLLKPFFNMHNH